MLNGPVPGTMSTIFINIISNFLFLALLIIIGWIIYVVSDRKNLKKFFGLSGHNKIAVYVSLIRAFENKTYSISGDQAIFDSWAVSYDEFRLAIKFEAIFKYIIPNLSDRPGGPGLLGKLFLSDIDVDVKPSVTNSNDIPELDTIISIGGTTFNLVSDFIQRSPNSRILITDKIRGDGFEFDDGYTGFIQRFQDDNNRYHFYAAGLSTLSSICAVEFLMNNWKSLHEQFGTKNFLILIKFSDLGSGTSPAVIFNKSW